MLHRLLERGKTSGREDDNVESIRKRFCVYCTTAIVGFLTDVIAMTDTYKEQTMPVIKHYAELGKVAEVSQSSVQRKVGTADVHFIGRWLQIDR